MKKVVLDSTHLLKFFGIDSSKCSVDDINHALLRAIIGFLGVPILFLFSVINLFDSKSFLLGIILSGFTALLFAIYLALKWTRQFKHSAYIAMSIFIALLAYLLITGGNSNTGFFWVFTFPLFSLMLLGPKKGIRADLITGILLAAILFTPALQIYSYTIPVASRIVIIYVLISLLCSIMGFVNDFLNNYNQNLEFSAREHETQVQLLRSEKLASIGRLSSGIAHEINNPVGFVSSNSTTLKDYVNRIKEIVQLYEKKIDPLLIEKRKKSLKYDFIIKDIDTLVMENLEGLARITNIVSNLKSFARGEQTTELIPADINEGLRSVLLLSKNEWKYYADVKTDFANLEQIECNINELNQVFLNIIINAVQAIKEQKKKEKGSIDIKTYKDSIWIICEIKDDGPGIPEAIQSKVFDPFFTTKEVGIGTGMGLNISYDIVRNRHKGELTLISVPGQGTTFTIKIPRKRTSNE